MEKILYTVKEVSKLFLVNSNSVYKLVRQGKLAHIRSLGRIKIPTQEVTRYIQENLKNIDK